MVFPKWSNYREDILTRDAHSGALQVTLDAPGADQWRYTLDWGSSWSTWTNYSGGTFSLESRGWKGTQRQHWVGEHVIIQYWSKLAGSSATIQHGDTEHDSSIHRVFPHLFAHGSFNQFGHDQGVANSIELDSDGFFKFHFMSEWPDDFAVNVWGIDAEGQQDLSFTYGDLNNDHMLDRWIPSMIMDVKIDFKPPPSPYLAYEFTVKADGYRYDRRPVGNRWQQLVLYFVLGIFPLCSGLFSVRFYKWYFCRIEFNLQGSNHLSKDNQPARNNDSDYLSKGIGRRCILIATLEYDIPDWGIDVKIGGLGTIAHLMGKYMVDHDIIWVVPCMGEVDYPTGQFAEPMVIPINGRLYKVEVQYHICG